MRKLNAFLCSLAPFCQSACTFEISPWCCHKENRYLCQLLVLATSSNLLSFSKQFWMFRCICGTFPSQVSLLNESLHCAVWTEAALTEAEFRLQEFISLTGSVLQLVNADCDLPLFSLSLCLSDGFSLVSTCRQWSQRRGWYPARGAGPRWPLAFPPFGVLHPLLRWERQSRFLLGLHSCPRFQTPVSWWLWIFSLFLWFFCFHFHFSLSLSSCKQPLQFSSSVRHVPPSITKKKMHKYSPAVLNRI